MVRTLLAILIVAAGLRAVHLADHLRSGLSEPEAVLESSDMSAFSIWAERIADGDLLSADTYHPYPEWMADIAPLETFEEWWGGREVFHQTPLYAYLLALSYWLSGGKLLLLVLQVLGSTAAVYFVYGMGTRLAERRAGLLAAALAATYTPSIVLDTMLLRASLSVLLTLAAIWMLVRVRDEARPWLAALTGAVLAAGFFMRPGGLFLLLLGPLVLLLEAEARVRWKRWMPPLALGAALMLTPFIARNAAVGAPLLAFSTRGPETVIHGNHRGADPGFLTLPASGAYRELMEAGHGSVPEALAAALGTWPEEGRIRWWAWHEARKPLAVMRDFEYANNVNFYFFRRATPGLGLLPTFGWIFGLAVVGSVLLVRGARDRSAGLLLAVAAAGVLATMLLTMAAGRYRLPLAMLATIPAGVTLSALWEWAVGRRWRPAVACLVAVGALTFVSYRAVPTRVLFDPAGEPHYVRGPDARLYENLAALRVREFAEEARLRAARGDRQAARELMSAYLAELRETIDETPPPADRNVRRTIINQTYVQLEWARDLFAEQGLGELAGAVEAELEWIRTNT